MYERYPRIEKTAKEAIIKGQTLCGPVLSCRGSLSAVKSFKQAHVGIWIND